MKPMHIIPRLTVALVLGLALPLFAGGGRNRVAGSEMAMAPVRGSVTVDGNLEEWDEGQAKFLSLYQGSAGEGKGAFDEYNARVAFQYDQNALYVGVWWNDPTPLGPEKSTDLTPPGDGLILSLPLSEMAHVALWRKPGGNKSYAVMSRGATPLAKGKAIAGVTQGYRVTGAATYTQEARIPWAAIGGPAKPGTVLRLAVELCYGGLNPAAGYEKFVREMMATGTSGSRWGGNMCWGFMDGLKSLELYAPSYNPYTGARVTLAPAGSAAPPNPPVLYLGNEQTRTTAMVAVPAGKISVDGKLDEWSAASGTTIASEPTLLPGRYAVTVHWAYAADGLYAGLRWHTGGPHLNVNNPDTLKRGYDGGDALQIRLGTDRVSHVDTWYYTAGKRPAMTIGYGEKFDEGSEPDALAKGAKMAMQPLPGGGYTQEIFFPWALITKTGAALQEGGSFQVVLDVFWSGLEGNRMPFIVNVQVAQPTGVLAIPFTAPRDGFYSVNIEDEQGGIVRRLLNHAKVRKGQMVADWDGLNDDGVPAPAGTYRFSGLHHAGLGLKYLMTLNNPGTPPWQTDDGTGEWGGDHAPPQTVATDDYGVYLGWPSAEDGCGFIGCDFTGKKRWGFFQTPHPAAAGGTGLLASDGEYLYFANEVMARPQKGEKELAYFKAVITCLDRKTGRRSGFSVLQPYHEIGAHNSTQVAVNWWWELWQKKELTLDTIAIHDDYYYSGRCAGGNLVGLAAGGGKLCVALRVPGEIVVFSRTDMKELGRWKAEKPGGLAFGPKGDLFAVSGKTVVRVDLATGALTPVVSSGLEAPVGLALDAQGTLYVSEWGTAQCVKAFSVAGQLLRTIGTPGGRPWVGTYDPKGMLQPRGLAVDKEGKLWVTEDDNFPRRVSVWDPATGALSKEILGSTTYGGVSGGIIDPQQPTRAISFGMLYEIDLAKEGYRPLATMWRRTAKEAFFAFGPSMGGNTPSTRFMEVAGRRFVTTSDFGALIIGELRPDGTWLPRAAVGGIFNRRDNSLVLKESELTWRMTTHPDALAGHGGDNYVWTDLNADGLVQAEEMQWRKQTPEFPLIGMHWGPGALDKEMNLVIGGDAIVRFAFQGWTANGAPKYDLAAATVLVPKLERTSSITTDAQGTILASVHGETIRWTKKQPYIRAYAPDGTLRWRIKAELDHKPMDNIVGDCFLGPIQGGGELGEIFGLAQWHGCYVPLLTTDGLFVGRLLRDPAEGGEPGPDMYRGETIQYLNRLDDGRVILSHGKNGHHLLQVTGLETAKRFRGNLALTAAQATLAGERLAAARDRQAKTAPIRIARSQEKDKPITVDGKLDEWSWDSAASIGPQTGTPRAEVALRTDDKTLYLAFKVFKNGPFLNRGEDVRQLFISGDAVDLQFCTDPAADPKRKAAGMGDCRLLFSRFGDKPVAVLYRVSVPGAKNPAGFRSPVREVRFDEVGEVTAAQVAVVDTPDGYVVEAAVPVKALFDTLLWPKRVIQGDAGIIVADSTGRRVARIYRFNHDTQVISDIPTEATLTPDQWGEVEVE